MGADWNDLHGTEGLDAVKRRLQGTVRPKAAAADASPEEEAAPKPAGHWRKALVRNDKGQIKANVANVRTVLAHDERWAGLLGYCAFSYRIMKRRAPAWTGGEVGEWTDGDTARLRVWLSDHYKFIPSVGDALDGALVVAQQYGYHPVREYLSKLRWDGQQRLETWPMQYLGVAGNDTYLRAVARKFLIGSVARVFDPGCKMDTVLIFEGEQGQGKSSAALALFDPWFSDAPIRLNDKDAYQTIHGVWCVELAELDSLNKAETTEAKSFFSQRRDRYRPSYGRIAQDFPRQCVFVGTTNQFEYLKDYTGNRRYWPIRCQGIDNAGLAAIRDQVWAEAVVRYREGVPWWVLEAEQALFESEQERRLQEDPWEYPIAKFLTETNKDFVTAAEVLTDALHKPLQLIQRADQNRVAPLMKQFGWRSDRNWDNGLQKQIRGYFAPGKGPKKR